MQNIWSNDYTLRANDFDKYDRILPSSVLSIFQDAAGRHGEEIGVGFKEMIERNYLWVIVRVKFEIVKQPKRYQKVNIKTWPFEPKRFSYRREYLITDESGESLIKGTSEWVIIDSVKRSLVSAPNLYSITDGYYEEMMLDKKIAKVPDFEATGAPHEVTPAFTELDLNNHVNNTKYANYVLDAISPNEDDILKTFQIDYRKEVMEGEPLEVFYTRQDGGILAKGLNKNGDTMFACKLEME
jgi:acyl-ACP thioesterase